MESALIVTHSLKSVPFFTDLLHTASFYDVRIVDSESEARMVLLDDRFDLVIVELDEMGESFVDDVVENGCTNVIMVMDLVPLNYVKRDRVLRVQKPVEKAMFLSLLMRLQNTGEDAHKLSETTETSDIIERAKRILMSLFEMSEREAHRYIEKSAMDHRITRREVAKRILNIHKEA